MTQADEETRRRAEQARQVGLFRYRLVSEVTGPQLSARERGRRVRELAAAEHDGPGGKVRVSEQTIRRWMRWWRAGGFEALVPAPARVTPRTPAEVLALAVALKRENPQRTAVQITRILRAQAGWAPSDRTLQRHFVRLELDRELEGRPQVFGRFEAARCNELWTGDALHGPVIAGRKTYLFAFLDDRSRAVMAARFGFSEDTVRLAAALRPALASRGVPERIYVDNGSAFVDSGCCAPAPAWASSWCTQRPAAPRAGARSNGSSAPSATSSSSRSPSEAAAAITGLEELNRLFTAWAETVYHPRPHSETGAPPLRRWQEGVRAPLPLPTPAQLREAFLWSEFRTVTKTATVSLHGNAYQVDELLTGRKVELVFDPFDLADIEVRYGGRSFGQAAAFTIGRHSHPKARPEQPGPPDRPATGIDYLQLVGTAHDTQLAERINYAALLGASHHPDQLPGQLTIDQALTAGEGQ